MEYSRFDRNRIPCSLEDKRVIRRRYRASLQTTTAHASGNVFSLHNHRGLTSSAFSNENNNSKTPSKSNNNDEQQTFWISDPKRERVSLPLKLSMLIEWLIKSSEPSSLESIDMTILRFIGLIRETLSNLVFSEVTCKTYRSPHGSDHNLTIPSPMKFALVEAQLSKESIRLNLSAFRFISDKWEVGFPKKELEHLVTQSISDGLNRHISSSLEFHRPTTFGLESRTVHVNMQQPLSSNSNHHIIKQQSISSANCETSMQQPPTTCTPLILESDQQRSVMRLHLINDESQ